VVECAVGVSAAYQRGTKGRWRGRSTLPGAGDGRWVEARWPVEEVMGDLAFARPEKAPRKLASPIP